MSDVDDLLLVMNSTGDFGFKYPIGNKELTEQIKKLEADGKIQYDPKAPHPKWRKAHE